MANEYLLRQVVNGLEHLAVDNAIVCSHLNLRATLYRYRAKFARAPFTAPRPPYPDPHASQAAAAELIERIADNAAVAVRYVGGSPTSPPALDGEVDEADILRLVLDWEVLQSGAYKSIVQLYGQQPAPAWAPSNPGASTADRLWAEVVAWFTTIAADTDRVIDVQRLRTSARSRATHADAKTTLSQRSRLPAGVLEVIPLLRRLEQGVHRTTLNTLTFAGLLPHHLFHAARVPR